MCISLMSVCACARECKCQEDPCGVPLLPTPKQVWTAGGGSCPLESRTRGGSRAADQHVLEVGKQRTVHSEKDLDGRKRVVCLA